MTHSPLSTLYSPLSTLYSLLSTFYSLKDMDKETTYTAALQELEALVGKMQSPDCDIDRLSGYTARALALLRFCKDKLTKTDEEIRKCLDELNADTAD